MSLFDMAKIIAPVAGGIAGGFMGGPAGAMAGASLGSAGAAAIGAATGADLPKKRHPQLGMEKQQLGLQNQMLEQIMSQQGMSSKDLQTIYQGMFEEQQQDLERQNSIMNNPNISALDKENLVRGIQTMSQQKFGTVTDKISLIDAERTAAKYSQVAGMSNAASMNAARIREAQLQAQQYNDALDRQYAANMGKAMGDLAKNLSALWPAKKTTTEPVNISAETVEGDMINPKEQLAPGYSPQVGRLNTLVSGQKYTENYAARAGLNAQPTSKDYFKTSNFGTGSGMGQGSLMSGTGLKYDVNRSEGQRFYNEPPMQGLGGYGGDPNLLANFQVETQAAPATLEALNNLWMLDKNAYQGW